MTNERDRVKTLTAMMGTYPKTEALKSHSISSPLVELDFAGIDVAQKGFKDAVRKLKFDVTELALMTFLLAYEAGKPYVLLPFVMNGGFHHKSILCRADSDLRPEDLPGKRVAMRSYSQTTPAWVRGVLSDEYGVRVEDVKWLTREGAHVEEYRDPAWVARSESGDGLEEMLFSGEADAIIAGGGLSGDPRIRTLIPEPKEAALEWHARTGVVPINHMVAIRKEIAESDGGIVREVFRMLRESRTAAGDTPPRNGPVLQPVGFEDVHAALEMGVRFAREQQLISRRYAADELYGAVLGALTAAAH
ncbi:substrate-binding domain-containing protein [Actinomadura montaniterrae]|uniref:Phosphate/phosphite/phosphonate ABC transporter substrate-binding protein n=1 Tax=Actinomadura montaniterrae TaxID=1803903 RepID=A0A6L3VX21_9ACTN|nr:phosphate ABC transporter substrate-binding protein [Actinomadura montaniterrae]KAB2381355.1 phosphate/phosphite/phosphonate ABC transporter substrate-binding protein [Actinomadura montaniterrae]